MLFFDTSAVVAWLRGDPKLRESMGDEGITVSAITVYELLWAAKRKSHKAVESSERFLEGCIILPVTADISRRAAHIRSEMMGRGKEKPMADTLIAATAEKEGLKFITFDKDFQEIATFADLDLHFL